MANSGVPVANISLQDISGAGTQTLFAAPDSGLCVPFGFIFTERGTPGQIYFGASKELTPLLGSATFDESSKFFTPASRFIGTAMAGQGVNVMKLQDPAAAKASIGLFLEVTPKDVVQYQKDVSGNRLLDTSGNPKPKLDAQSQPVTAPGLKVKWSYRPLTNSEDPEALTSTTVANGGVNTTIYPILAARLDAGSFGNRQGFSIGVSRSGNAAASTAIASLLYRFIPMELPTSVSTTAQAIADNFGQKGVDVSFKDVARYERTAQNYALRAILEANYVDPNTGVNTLPYELQVYGENLAAVASQLIALTDALENVDPYLIDLMTGKDDAGHYYDNLEIDPLSNQVVNGEAILYAAGGSDGDTSFEKLQELMRDWLAGQDHGEFTNLQQHPMTHYNDPGLTVDTKYLLFNMLDLRDNFKVDVATQDVLLKPNTRAQDLAVAQGLNFRAQMHPESAINGVGCMRVGIYAHCAKLRNGTSYAGNVPFTMNRLIQRRDLDGGTYIKGSSGGRPNSEVTIFRAPNWVADDFNFRELTWESALNVVMHANRTVLFYPALRTVYPDDTSLLSDDEVSDRIIYMMKIAREVWSIYAGKRQTPKEMYPIIERDVDIRCANTFSGDNLTVKSTVFQSALDASLGYAISINLEVTGTMPMRQANFNVIVAREQATA